LLPIPSVVEGPNDFENICRSSVGSALQEMAGHNRKRRSAVMLTMVAGDLTVSAELLPQDAVEALRFLTLRSVFRLLPDPSCRALN